MKLHFVRHGQTEWNKAGRVQGRSDIPLNEYGRYLAEETGKGLKHIPFALAYTSPLIRARETAEIILAGRDVPIYDEIRIQEMSFGTAEGMCCRGENQEPDSAEFNKLFTDTANYEVPKGGESILEVMNRTQEFLWELYENQELQDKEILITSHGATLTAMMNLIKGNKEIATFWENGVPLNCAVTEVEVRGGKPEILSEGKLYQSM
ncbi:MAG: histidine phosphatase family protein [Muricomes sp.]